MWWLGAVAYTVVAFAVWVWLAFLAAESAAGGRHRYADVWGAGGHVYGEGAKEPGVWVGAVLWPLIAPLVAIRWAGIRVINRIERKRYVVDFTMQEMARRGEEEERRMRTSKKDTSANPFQSIPPSPSTGPYSVLRNVLRSSDK